MTVGIALLALVGITGVTDSEKVMPVVLLQYLPTGIRALFIIDEYYCVIENSPGQKREIDQILQNSSYIWFVEKHSATIRFIR